jgi:hypothetical protein
MARQAGMMTEQIAHRDPVGRNSVMQAKFRDVIPDRLLPIKRRSSTKRARPVEVNDFVIEQIMK